MKVRTSYPDCDYITADEHYEVTDYDPEEMGDLCAGAWIVDDLGSHIYILLSKEPNCGHLDARGTWEIVEC